MHRRYPGSLRSRQPSPQFEACSHTRRINAADDFATQILPVPPCALVHRRIIRTRRHNPRVALRRQTRQHRRAERPIRYIELKQQTLLLGLLAPDRAERAHEVPLRVSRRGVPAVDGDEDLLPDKARRLARAHADARELARGGLREDGLEGVRGRGGVRKRGAVDVADVAGGVGEWGA